MRSDGSGNVSVTQDFLKGQYIFQYILFSNKTVARNVDFINVILYTMTRD